LALAADAGGGRKKIESGKKSKPEKRLIKRGASPPSAARFVGKNWLALDLAAQK